MKTRIAHSSSSGWRRTSHAFTLVEVLVAMALGMLLLSIVAMLFGNGARSFACLGNYRDLDAKSMMALDVMGREIRGATALTAFSTNSATPYFTLANGSTNITFTYYPTAGTVVMTKTGQSAITNLTGCDRWNFSFYTRAPNTNSFSTNITFYGTTDSTACKLIQMSWKCSRTILGSKLNTESVQTAQIVLRNKTQ